MGHDGAFLMEECNRMVFEVRIKNSSTSEKESSKSASPISATEQNNVKRYYSFEN
jgi:hypothetical protein